MENIVEEPQGQDEEVLKVPTVSEYLASLDDTPLAEDWPQVIEAELARLEPTAKAFAKRTFPEATDESIDDAWRDMASTWHTDFPYCQPSNRALVQVRLVMMIGLSNRLDR